MSWLIKHALRTLIKEGDPEALALVGFSANPKIKVTKIVLNSDKIEVGKALGFETKIKSVCNQGQWLMIDYIIHHMKKNGKLSRNVFK